MSKEIFNRYAYLKKAKYNIMNNKNELEYWTRKYFNHKKEYYLYNNVPIHKWWKTQTKQWFSNCYISPQCIQKVQYSGSSWVEFIINHIIYMDQIMRHPPFKNPDPRICSIVLDIIQDKHVYTLYPWREQPIYDVFLLLVLRHYNHYILCNHIIQDIIKLYYDECKEEHCIPSIYYRFLNTTLNKMIYIKEYEILQLYIHTKNNTNINQFKYILDKTSPYTSKHINHCIKYLHNDLYKTQLKNIYNSHNTLCIQFYNKPITLRIMLNAIEETLKFWCNKHHIIYESWNGYVTISLSGGVDSMVLSYLCSLLSYERSWNVQCIHICYKNRNETNDEIDYLKYWCNSVLRCPLYVREICEITRHRYSHWRDIYETITKKIRFHSYSLFGHTPILLGHNMDDTLENVFCNISQQIHYNNLFGMNPVEVLTNDVYLLRPFLDIPKTGILGCSHSFCIPYLNDSTPPWSNRGRMRDTLMKQLHLFDSRLLYGFYRFVKYHNSIYNIHQQQLKSWIDTNVHPTQLNIYIYDPIFTLYGYDITFWTTLWFYLNLPSRPSNKAFLCLIQHLKHSSKQIFNITLNSSFYIQKTKLNILKLIQYTFY